MKASVWNELQRVSSVVGTFLVGAQPQKIQDNRKVMFEVVMWALVRGQITGHVK